MTTDFSSRPSKILIDLNNLEHNLKLVRATVRSSKIMAVVKANAYGHGLIESAKRLEQLKIDYLGAALLEEGIQLREAGIKTPVHVFGGILGEQIESFIKYDLELTASSLTKLEQINQSAKNLDTKAKVHLKVDTGMGRIGVRPESAIQLISSAKSFKHIQVKGIFSHFACSDETDPSFTIKQLNDFLPVVNFAKQYLGQSLLAHISNSGAVLKFPEANLDMVRPGLILYGVVPSINLKNILDLKPVMSVKSKIVFFKVVKKGSSVSYSRTWIADKDSRVLTVPIGYGDGYLRALSNKSEVLIRGKKYPVIGRVCMDQLMVNISSDSAYNNEIVTLIGAEGSESITVEELADLAHTVPHEILTSLNLRLAREYLS